ncbi:SDR family oxidoreductase [Nocardioides zeae]|uniref:SDR family oxidoreductase n=1 Tax=Nocardioides imazamoxiresistens TaxID=3231893 RepID=A0ABU3PXF7_9ACTN|nr:SDR family oxidoreductase [Nocardioides zeae]MDT9593927.1 SDR family oxidoreductase [Nocardioides zeae]
MTTTTSRTVRTSDGVDLAVVEEGPVGAPVLVLVHGYPDDRTVWDGVAAHLVDRFRVVRYDVRGCGASGVPARTRDYALERLATDLREVVDAVSPGVPVHLAAHDWGSIQTWEAVTDPAHAGRFSSFTSISGPSLDLAARWLRAGARHPRAALAQLAASSYIALFQLPVLPELAARSGLLDRAVAHSERAGTPWRRGRTVTRRPRKDAVNGLELYRANFLERMRRPRRVGTDVPVQVLAPTHDAHVSVALQTRAPVGFATRLHTRTIVGNHWVVAQRPATVAAKITDLVDHTTGGPLPRSLRPRSRHGDLAGRLALVTGAGSGIGRATCVELARRGADVVVTDLDETTAKETVGLVEQAGGEAWAYVLDVTDPAAWDRVAETVATAHGVPYVVVNNAGIGMGGPFLATTLEDWRRVVDVNLWGVVHGSRVLGRMLAEHGEGGHLVNVASAAAFAPSRSLPAYAATKAAVLSLTESLRAELAYAGIGVTAVCPGFVDTNITRTTRFVGTDPDEQRRLSEHQQAAYRRRDYPPERVARHLVDAMLADRPVAAISAEARALQLGHRYLPALTRRFARLDLNEL